MQLSFNISIAPNLPYNKNKLYKTWDYWYRDKLNFDFLEKGLGMVFSAHLAYDFSRKMFLMLCFINWPKFILWLSLLLAIFSNMCIATVFFPAWGTINFEINLVFIIKPFFFMTEKSRQNFKYLDNKKSFKDETK